MRNQLLAAIVIVLIALGAIAAKATGPRTGLSNSNDDVGLSVELGGYGQAVESGAGGLALPSPAYYAFHYQDHPDNTAPTTEELDQMAETDIWVFNLFSHHDNELFFSDLGDSLRARNDDIVLLTYFQPMFPRNDWVSNAAGTLERRCADYLATLPDSAGYGKNISGYVADGTVFPSKFVNIMNTDIADTFAVYAAEELDESGIDGEYSGFFLDSYDETLYNWHIAGRARAALDYDQDGTAFGADTKEQDAWSTFHLRFVTQLRAEFADRSMASRLLVPNGDWARGNAAEAAAVDGVMWENWNIYDPAASGTTEAEWEAAFATGDLFVNAQTDPPLIFWHAECDSSSAYISEPVAMAQGAPIQINQDRDQLGNLAIPEQIRRLPDPGEKISVDASNDTLRVVYENYELRLDLANIDGSDYGLHPYIVLDGTDTLSIGGGWLRRALDDGYTVYKAAITARASYTNSDSLKANGGEYDQIVNTTTDPTKFWSAHMRNVATRYDDVAYNTSVMIPFLSDNTVGYLSDGSFQATGALQFYLGSLTDFVDPLTEILSATLSIYTNSSGTFTANDTLYVVGGNHSDMDWMSLATSNNASYNHMDHTNSVLWPSRNGSTYAGDWLGLDAWSSMPIGDHPYLTDITFAPDTEYDFDMSNWATEMAAGETNSGIWFLGRLVDSPSKAFYVLKAENATAEYRPLLVLEYRVADQDTESPSTITDLAAVGQDGNVALSWSAATDNVGLRATNPYGVYSGPSGGPYTLEGYSQTTSYDDGTVTNGVQYWYIVVAFDEAGNYSADSNEATATPSAGDTTPPEVPGNFAATPGDGQILVSWDAIADAAGDFDHYNVYGGTNAGTINPDSLLTPSGTTGTWYSHTGLSNGTTYYYEVTSVDATGNESNPATANATPAQAPLAFGDLNIESIIDAGSDGDMDATVDAYLNRSAFVKARFRNQDGSYPAGTWLTPSSIDWYGLYDTAIGTATFYNDGTDIDVTWTAGDYGREQLEVSIAGGAWTLVDANATSPYNYTADQRYPLRFRVFGVDSDPIAYSDTVTAGTFYNQCQYLYTQWQAAEVQDVDVITSAEVAAFFQTPDLVAPDTTGVFAGVTVDTTSGFVVLTLDDMTIEEPGQVWVQWLNTSGFVWTGPEEWNPVTAATTVGDSVHTGKTTAQYDGEIIFTRFKLRDDESTPNVSAWVDHQEPFVRASEGDYEVASMGFYPTAWVSGSNVKVVIYDSSKNLVATSSGTALTGTNAWETASWAGPTLVAGSDYYIGVIADGSIKVGATSVYNSNLDDTGSYASPPDPVSGTGQAAGVLCVYVKNAAGTVLLGYDGAADGTASAYLGGKVAYTSSSYTVATQ